MAERDGPRLSRLGVLAGSVALARRFSKDWEDQRNIGVVFTLTTELVEEHALCAL